jgi:serine/threonine-protein kinase
MLLEYVEGANLRELMIKGDAQVQDNLGELLIDMASALAHVHASGFMHLDFKPENLMVSRGGRVLLCDFDTAQPIPNSPIKLPKKSGTPLYMPPEIVNGWGCDQRADIYSFAVTAYELLTRIKPFEGQSPKEMLRNQLDPKYRIRKPRDFNDGIPILLENMLLKCLSYLPENRYPYMAHIRRDLHKSLGVR